MIRFNEEEVWRSFGFYKSLVKRFLRRFSAKLKPKDSDIWNKKLMKTAQDVEDFSRKKPKSNSTHHINMLVHSSQSKSRLKNGDVFDTSSKSEKDENIQKVSDALDDQNSTNKTCEACTCNSKYVVNLDSILVLIFAIQKLLQSDHPCTKMYRAEEEGFEVPYRDGSISEVPTNEDFFDDAIDGTEKEDETPEEQNASETSSNGQPHEFQREIHSV